MPIRYEPNSSGVPEKFLYCNSCALVTINGVIVHEHRCPDAWQDSIIECKNCGTEFTPSFREQKCCDDECYEAYYYH